MQRKARIIAQSYHYISEGMILFLIVLAVIQFSEVMEAPYWSYLFILLASAAMFSFFAFKELNVIFYILAIFILGSAFYFLLFPISLVIVFAVLLPYRYWRIEKKEIKRREIGYIAASGLLVAYLMIVNGAHEIVWLFIIQFILTFIGYYYSNLPMVGSQEKSNFVSSFWVMLSGILVAGVVAFYFLAEVMGRALGIIWQGVAFLLTSLADLVLWGLSGIEPDPYTFEEEPEGDQGIQESELGDSIMAGIEGYVVTFIVIALAIALIAGIILFLKLRKADREKEADLLESLYDTTYNETKYGGESSRIKSLFQFFKKPEHPARRLVFQFEKKMSKTKDARMAHETIERWLTRIGTGSELEVYQKARYGNREVSDEELDKLKSELHQLELLLKQAR